jgi:hypothetical protein
LNNPALLAASPIRGIPDLIGRTRLPGKSEAEVAAYVRELNAQAAPNIRPGQQVIKAARGDSRPPSKIKEQGGLFGRDPGVVTVAHARQIVRTVRAMPLKAQQDWVSRWKWPTPPPEERNPWVATGIGAEGGQKEATSEYFAELPLQFEQSPPNVPQPQMVVGTDTGNIDTAQVIGVRLGGGDEVIVLTGIPWKYIKYWFGSIDGTSQKWAADDAAARLASPK